MSQKKLYPVNGGFSLRMALEVMQSTPDVDRVEIVDYEDSHVTYARGSFAWHRPGYDVMELGGVNDALVEILTAISATAHFRIVHFPQVHCERSVRE